MDDGAPTPAALETQTAPVLGLDNLDGERETEPCAGLLVCSKETGRVTKVLFAHTASPVLNRDCDPTFLCVSPHNNRPQDAQPTVGLDGVR